MYTDKGGFFDGVGTQLKRNFFPKYFAVVGAYCGLAYGLTYMYAAAGPRPKTHSRKWKELEYEDPRYPFQDFPDIQLPPGIDKDPKADCWRILHVVPRKERIIIEAWDSMRGNGFVAKPLKETR
jgi:hypothetical protein